MSSPHVATPDALLLTSRRPTPMLDYPKLEAQLQLSAPPQVTNQDVSMSAIDRTHSVEALPVLEDVPFDQLFEALTTPMANMNLVTENHDINIVERIEKVVGDSTDRKPTLLGEDTEINHPSPSPMPPNELQAEITNDTSLPEENHGNDNSMSIDRKQQTVRIGEKTIEPLNIPLPTTYAEATNLATRFPEIATDILLLPLTGIPPPNVNSSINSPSQPVHLVETPRWVLAIADFEPVGGERTHTASTPDWAIAMERQASKGSHAYVGVASDMRWGGETPLTLETQESAKDKDWGPISEARLATDLNRKVSATAESSAGSDSAGRSDVRWDKGRGRGREFRPSHWQGRGGKNAEQRFSGTFVSRTTTPMVHDILPAPEACKVDVATWGANEPQTTARKGPDGGSASGAAGGAAAADSTEKARSWQKDESRRDRETQNACTHVGDSGRPVDGRGGADHATWGEDQRNWAQQMRQQNQNRHQSQGRGSHGSGVNPIPLWNPRRTGEREGSVGSDVRRGRPNNGVNEQSNQRPMPPFSVHVNSAFSDDYNSDKRNSKRESAPHFRSEEEYVRNQPPRHQRLEHDMNNYDQGRQRQLAYSRYLTEQRALDSRRGTWEDLGEHYQRAFEDAQMPRGKRGPFGELHYQNQKKNQNWGSNQRDTHSGYKADVLEKSVESFMLPGRLRMDQMISGHAPYDLEDKDSVIESQTQNEELYRSYQQQQQRAERTRPQLNVSLAGRLGVPISRAPNVGQKNNQNVGFGEENRDSNAQRNAMNTKDDTNMMHAQALMSPPALYTALPAHESIWAIGRPGLKHGFGVGDSTGLPSEVQEGGWIGFKNKLEPERQGRELADL